MAVRPARAAAASVLALGALGVTVDPAAAGEVHTRTDTFQQCQVQSRLELLDSGDVEVRTSLDGTHSNCAERSLVRVRVTYVDGDGDPQEVLAEGVDPLRYTFAAPGAAEVTSFHSTDLESCVPDEPETCFSPEYRLESK